MDAVTYALCKKLVNGLINGAPEAYDTIKEIGSWIEENEGKFTPPTNEKLGMVKAPNATADQQETVGVDKDGFLKVRGGYNFATFDINLENGQLEMNTDDGSGHIPTFSINNQGILEVEFL